MKPAPFKYHRPTTLDEALAILAEVAEEDGRILAGGQTLVPMMALRLAYPPHLVDINAIPELARTRVEDGRLAIGALVRHADLQAPLGCPPLDGLLAEVASHIAHYPIRTRGTFCGSLANADPASEWCLVAATLGAEFVIRSADGTRSVGVEDYFQGVMATAIGPGEMLVEARLPLLPADSLWGFYEFSRRAGDFALGMALATLRLEGGVVGEARIGVGGAEEHPRRIAEAEAALVGRAPDEAAFRAAAAKAAAVIDPLEDHATDGTYRRELVETVVRRALSAAMAHRQARPRTEIEARS
ncbi:FAD binding domain-containing protein [Propylenella binzhouense]|uniref:Xanthine dehydrogenase family protein subunit M n=1 Tax=Propylenella binzhouense TaxID=2555902 RepID=A0A964T380_9HYPH|nr:xanthine dehydrogenase family protein subunit M [Propylenella binzhouense]MYZ47550.1 xanthine dehydrogenase family protein subunit M [Propylenella binzhouense]